MGKSRDVRTIHSHLIQSIGKQNDEYNSRGKGGRKSAHKFTGVAAQRRAARKLRNQRKSK
jgi:hypothetical protein